VMGTEVAIPIMGRDEMLGIALMDRKVTGEAIDHRELEGLFHLLEQVGQAISNIGDYGRLLGSNQLLGDVLKERGSACLVVGPDLGLLHINRAARRLLGGANRRSGTIGFGDLPEALGSKIYQVLKTGAAIPPFRYQSDEGGKSVYNISIVPIQSALVGPSVNGNSALLVAEDRTQAEQLKELELEAANLRLVSNMADRLAAEIGNAIVPLSVHFQLFDDRIKEPEFRKSLKSVMGDTVKRVGRLANQMRSIYGSSNRGRLEGCALVDLLNDASRAAIDILSAKKANLDLDESVGAVTLLGNKAALSHAFSELLLNGYQASGTPATVTVRVLADKKPADASLSAIRFEDKGEGFSNEVAQKAVDPFYTTKTAGVGLGLSAAKKVIEDHGGRIEIIAAPPAKHGVVDVYLPQESEGE